MMASRQTEQAFIRSYDQYADDIFRFCYWRVHHREQAQDLMQETFVRCWDYLAQGKKINHLRAFLYQTARHLIIDATRRPQPVQLDVEELERRPNQDHQRMVVDAETSLALDHLTALDEPYQEAVYLRYVADLPPREIAELLGVSANVVSVRIHRGLEQLKHRLAEEH